jgi:uncharacterized membrane protein
MDDELDDDHRHDAERTISAVHEWATLALPMKDDSVERIVARRGDQGPPSLRNDDGLRRHDNTLVGRPNPEAPPPAVVLCMALPAAVDTANTGIATWWNRDGGLATSVDWWGANISSFPHNASPWVADPMTGKRPIANQMSHRHRTNLGAHVSNDAMSAEHLAPMCEIVHAARKQQNFVGEMLNGVLSNIRDKDTVWTAWPREGAKRAANLAGGAIRQVAHPDGVVTNNAQCVVFVTPDGLETPLNNWGRMHREITVAESLTENRPSGGGVFAKWVVESPGDTLDSISKLMSTGSLPRDWEPSSVRRARLGEEEAVESQERCYELAFAVQEACKGAARLCAGQWAQLRVDMQMDGTKIAMHDRRRPSWSIPVEAFRAEPPPPRRMVVYDLRPPGSLFTQVTAVAMMTVVVVVGFCTVKLTIESVLQRTPEGATENSFVDIILAARAATRLDPCQREIGWPPRHRGRPLRAQQRRRQPVGLVRGVAGRAGGRGRTDQHRRVRVRRRFRSR